MVANAEEAGYRLLDRMDLSSSEHNIGGVRGTKEALRWTFDKAKPGDVSGLYECGESDHMMVVGLVGIKPEGYRPLKAVQDQLRAEIVCRSCKSNHLQRVADCISHLFVLVE